MPSMFNEPFPTFPSMFEGPFNGTSNGNVFDNIAPANKSQESVKPNKASQGGERIIPIKVVNTNSDSLNCNQVDNSRSSLLLHRSLIID